MAKVAPASTVGWMRTNGTGADCPWANEPGEALTLSLAGVVAAVADVAALRTAWYGPPALALGCLRGTFPVFVSGNDLHFTAPLADDLEAFLNKGLKRPRDWEKGRSRARRRRPQGTR